MEVTGSRTRRRLLAGIAVLWLLGTGAAIALPAPTAVTTLAVAEGRLRPWVEEVLAREPDLVASVRLVDPSASADPDGAWLGLAAAGPVADRADAPVALRRHVVVVWEASRERMGLTEPEAPVDWAAVRAALDGEGRFVLPLPSTPLGRDGLALLAAAGSRTTGRSGADPALVAWLRPFYARQLRPRADDGVQVDDWAQYRTALGDAGLLPEPDALALVPVVARQARLHLRYPPTDTPRPYVLRTPARPTPAQERLARALAAPEAQRRLGDFGYRPLADGPAPTSGPFVDLRALGARWDARLVPAERPAGLDALAAALGR